MPDQRSELNTLRWTVKPVVYTPKGIQGQTLYINNNGGITEDSESLQFDRTPVERYYMLLASESRYEVIEILEVAPYITTVVRGMAGTPKFSWPSGSLAVPIEFME